MLLTDVVIGKGMQLTHGLEAMKNWESQELSLHWINILTANLDIFALLNWDLLHLSKSFWIWRSLHYTMVRVLGFLEQSWLHVERDILHSVPVIKDQGQWKETAGNLRQTENGGMHQHLLQQEINGEKQNLRACKNQDRFLTPNLHEGRFCPLTSTVSHFSFTHTVTPTGSVLKRSCLEFLLCNRENKRLQLSVRKTPCLHVSPWQQIGFWTPLITPEGPSSRRS